MRRGPPIGRSGASGLGMLTGMSKQRAQRRPRPTTARPTTARRAPVLVRATGPADLLRHVPELVAVDPADSLVVILFARSQGTKSRTHGALRVDLPHTADEAELQRWASAVLQTALRVEGLTGVALAVYTPETFAPSGRLPAAAPLRAAAKQAERMGLEVLGRFSVAADGWGSLDDPDLPRGGRALSLIEPAGPVARRLRTPADVTLASGARRRRFSAQYAEWWARAEGPGGVLHGVPLQRPGSGFGVAAEREPAMQRYRWGRDIVEVVDLTEAMLEPHDPDAETPCACRALLFALAERQGVENLVLLQFAWGRDLGLELWTAANAPRGRDASLQRLTAAISGGRFRRPDIDRIDAAIAALIDTAQYVPPEDRAPLDSMLCWLHWASGGSSVAAAYAERALRAHPGRDIPSLVLGKVRQGEMPAWAFRRNPTKPDPYEALVGQQHAAAG